MNYLFVDVETTGPVLDYSAPVSDSKAWPHIVQIAYILATEDRQVIFQGKNIVRIPDKVTINEKAFEVHGITEEFCKTYGLTPMLTYTLFDRMLSNCDVIVCHNIKFDLNVIRAEYFRYDMHHTFKEKKRFCTMTDKAVMNFVDARKSNNALKWPKLSELYYKCFGTTFDNAHDAFADINATMHSFWHLIDLGIINPALL